MSRWAALRRDAEAIGAAALRAVDAEALVRRHLATGIAAIPEVRGSVRVLGAGKAAAAMARAVEEALGDRLDGGIVAVPDGYELPLRRIEVRIASHPVPDERSVRAGEAMLAAAAAARPDDLWIGLWSGGASALIEVPAPGWTLGRIRAETERRLADGTPIGALNAARRAWSAIKGGRLAAAGPGRWWNLVLSDVPGDDPATVGSGPAIGPGGEHRVIGGSRDALEAARAEAFALRYAVVVLDPTLSGETRDAGARLARAISAVPRPGPPMALLMAGEPVVSGVPPGAVGGRMQELALAAALDLDGADAVVLALATDGRDGSSDAAGALVDGGTAGRGRAAGRDAGAALTGHAATGFLEATGDLVRTGPTRTNVRDLVVALIGAGSGD